MSHYPPGQEHRWGDTRKMAVALPRKYQLLRESVATILGLKLRLWMIEKGFIKGDLIKKEPFVEGGW